MNRVELKGRVGNVEPLRIVKGDLKLLKFSISTSESKKNQDGSWDNKYTYHPIVVFGARAAKMEAEIKRLKRA